VWFTEDLMLKIDTICLKDFTVSWNDINNNSLCGGVSEYVLTVTPDGHMIRLSSTTFSYNITGLMSNTIYGVTVTAIFQSGDTTMANINVITREETCKYMDISIYMVLYVHTYVCMYAEQ